MAIAAAGPQRPAGDVAIGAEHPAPPVVNLEVDVVRRGPKKEWEMGNSKIYMGNVFGATL
jgi:hypothetical protein